MDDKERHMVTARKEMLQLKIKETESYLTWLKKQLERAKSELTVKE
jgi:hypothetical protein